MKAFLTIICLLLSFQFYGQGNILLPTTIFSSIDNKVVANVRTIVKDKYGFVWIGTQDGLLRYDGITATPYNKNTLDRSHAIMNNDIDALLTIPEHDFLWVLNSYAGVSKIE